MELTPEKKRRGAGLVAFKALLPEIRKALEDGWTAKAVYDELTDKKRLSVIGFRQFSRYVQEYLGEVRDEVRSKKPARREEGDGGRAPAAPAPAEGRSWRDPGGDTGEQRSPGRGGGEDQHSAAVVAGSAAAAGSGDAAGGAERPPRASGGPKRADAGMQRKSFEHSPEPSKDKLV
jgi:hypothetical protein